MKHLFVPYEIALKLKEKGFDEKCLFYYSDFPLYQQVIDWFREKHKIHIEIHPQTLIKLYECHNWYYTLISYDRVSSPYIGNYYETLNKAIEEALKLI